MLKNIISNHDNKILKYSNGHVEIFAFMNSIDELGIEPQISVSKYLCIWSWIRFQTLGNIVDISKKYGTLVSTSYSNDKNIKIK